MSRAAPGGVLAILTLFSFLGSGQVRAEAGPRDLEGSDGTTSRREAGGAHDFHEILRPTPVTKAVERGVEYLRRSQLTDGSWLSPMGKNTGVIGLAALSILSAGNEPGRGSCGECVDRAVAFILSRNQGGMLVTRDTSHGPMYEHGIATLLLGQVLGMEDETQPGFERIYRSHRDAVDLILRAQAVPRPPHAAGGWRYQPTSNDSDISVSGWQLLALRAAQDCGLPVPKRSIDLAVLYIKRCQKPTGGFGYMPGDGYEPNAARTGTGILALQLCGEFQSEEARRGGDWLLRNPLEWKGPFFYYAAYYAAQAMYQLGGDYWSRWRPLNEGIILERQSADGSWPAPPHETHESQAGLAYTTALAILSLTVDYKYLPIYQR